MGTDVSTHFKANNREFYQTLQSVASDLGLYYLSMLHKKTLG